MSATIMLVAALFEVILTRKKERDRKARERFEDYTSDGWHTRGYGEVYIENGAEVIHILTVAGYVAVFATKPSTPINIPWAAVGDKEVYRAWALAVWRMM